MKLTKSSKTLVVRVLEASKLSSSSGYEALVASGVLGSLKGLPADLSTNPKHMEGFGK